MKAFKNFIAIFIAVCTLFSFAACGGEYNYAVGGGTHGNGSSGGGNVVAPELDDDPTNDFTVTLKANGESYSPRMEMYARWSDGFSVFTAPIDKNGVARIDGLDGDYRVTLSAVPNEYTYDPNGHIATNDMRNVVLNLYTVNHLAGSGTGKYDCYSFSKTGVYSASIKDSSSAIWFLYAPDKSGTYSIESWVDTTADNINPRLEAYYGSAPGWVSDEPFIKIDEGGALGSFTRNFLYTVQIAKENISSGGQVAFTFAIKAESKNNKYPITVTFAVKRDGNFELGGVDNISGREMVVPKHNFSNYNVADHEYGSEYTLKYPEYLLEGTTNVYAFDGDRFKVWKESDGGDNFYHVYNKEAYPETDGYGPILYANITSTCRFLDRPFSTIEYNTSGEIINSALRIKNKNYKHFIEGYSKLSTAREFDYGLSSYYCVATCPCHKAKLDAAQAALDAGAEGAQELYAEALKGWACTAACTACTSSCSRCPEELIGHEGYQHYANSKGLVAVTEELKEFLLGYATKQTFFYDGRGTLEVKPTGGKYYQAKAESGWLFACLYYEKA